MLSRRRVGGYIAICVFLFILAAHMQCPRQLRSSPKQWFLACTPAQGAWQALQPQAAACSSSAAAHISKAFCHICLGGSQLLQRFTSCREAFRKLGSMIRVYAQHNRTLASELLSEPANRAWVVDKLWIANVEVHLANRLRRLADAAEDVPFSAFEQASAPL
jgi:hypothetical protein